MEMFVLGLAIGGVAGVGSSKLARKRGVKEAETNEARSRRSRPLVKSAARAYLALTGTTAAAGGKVRAWTSGIRSDLRDAVQEARQAQDGAAAPR
jgi:hypothetical protein